MQHLLDLSVSTIIINRHTNRARRYMLPNEVIAILILAAFAVLTHVILNNYLGYQVIVDHSIVRSLIRLTTWTAQHNSIVQLFVDLFSFSCTCVIHLFRF